MDNILIPDATNNLRSSLNRMFDAEASYGLPSDDLERFKDGGHLSDAHKQMLTRVLFKDLDYNPKTDALVSRPTTSAIHQATAYLRRLVKDCRDKTELIRRTKINTMRLDNFIDGQKDLSPDEKSLLVKFFGIDRSFDAKLDALVTLPASASFVTPPDFKAVPWREQQMPTMRSVDT